VGGTGNTLLSPTNKGIGPRSFVQVDACIFFGRGRRPNGPEGQTDLACSNALRCTALHCSALAVGVCVRSDASSPSIPHSEHEMPGRNAALSARFCIVRSRFIPSCGLVPPQHTRWWWPGGPPRRRRAQHAARTGKNSSRIPPRRQTGGRHARLLGMIDARSRTHRSQTRDNNRS
jgi:hypothetical protein